MATTLLSEGSETALPSAKVDGESLWLPTAELEPATGWHLDPEGLCKGERCVPLPPDADLVHQDMVDVAAFARHLGQAVLHSEDASTWAIGDEPPPGLGMPVRPAPDFSLPDASGRVRNLAEWRGQKIFLAVWASW